LSDDGTGYERVAAPAGDSTIRRLALFSQMKRMMRDLPLNLDKIPTHFLMDVVLFGAWACSGALS